MPEPMPRATDRDADPSLTAELARAALDGSVRGRSAAETALLAHVAEVRQTILAARAELAALDAGDITRNQIPSATDELDAIVQHTAAATDAILDACETLDRVAGDLDGSTAAVLREATTRIYEACSFQDITGQRIGKIVATLKTIDARVTEMADAFGADDGAIRPRLAERVARGGPLMSGPQLPAHAMQQSDVDQLLAGFD